MVTELLASLFFGLSIFFLRSSFLMAASLLSSRRIININGSEAIDNTVSHVVLEASGKVEQLSCFEELNPTNCVRNPKNSCHDCTVVRSVGTAKKQPVPKRTLRSSY